MERKLAEEKHLSKTAGEPVMLQEIGGVIYAFTDNELGALRLFAYYNANGASPHSQVRVGHSENLEKWYVSIDV